ncbi:hypothetical protein [Desulforhopalus sp. IMCC35007]|uniref:hypothetical protein n=1 Tax=Desulforhopalus sp. IMCC35007 TaxID=2569543 RepID=UPI0010ADFF73|nr:hypothetical protein [Desulforhopalus sp. IMCC35007]TKB06107.1 hypothetical protein FCL48_22280 [Desulforhopalus sp. IMCC35007]
MRKKFLLSFACTLLLLGLIVPMNVAIAGVSDELRIRLDEIGVLDVKLHKLVEQEEEVGRKIQTTTDPDLKNQLRSQHQEILQEITQISKSKLDTLGGAVDLLSGYSPASYRDWKVAIHETERLVNLLQMERDGILGDADAPDELVIESGIEKLLERAEYHLNFLYEEEKKITLKKQQDKSEIESDKKIEGSEKPGPKDSLMVWFDKQETAVKAALIAAIASIIGALTTIVVAVIRRRN